MSAVSKSETERERERKREKEREREREREIHCLDGQGNTCSDSSLMVDNLKNISPQN